MSDTAATEILKIKDKISNAKEQMNEYNGKLSLLIENLKKEYGCDSIQESEKKLSELSKEVHNLNDNIEEKLSSFKNKYGELWNS